MYLQSDQACDFFLESTLNTLDPHSTWSCTGQNHKQKHYGQNSPCPEILDVKFRSWLYILPLLTKVAAVVPQTHNCNINSPLHSFPVHHLPQHLPASTAQYLKNENAVAIVASMSVVTSVHRLLRVTSCSAHVGHIRDVTISSLEPNFKS